MKKILIGVNTENMFLRDNCADISDRVKPSEICIVIELGLT